MNGIKIRGMGRAVPAHAVTNEDLAKVVETSDEWITSRTGIRRRHHVTTESPVELCVQAAKEALEKGGVAPEEIGAVIVATLTPEHLVPCTAALVQKALGLPEDQGGGSKPLWSQLLSLHNVTSATLAKARPRANPCSGGWRKRLRLLMSGEARPRGTDTGGGIH